MSWSELVRVEVDQDHISQTGRVSQWMYARLALAPSMTVAACQSVSRVCLAGQVSQWQYARLTQPGHFRGLLSDILTFQVDQWVG